MSKGKYHSPAIELTKLEILSAIVLNGGTYEYSPEDAVKHAKRLIDECERQRAAPPKVQP